MDEKPKSHPEPLEEGLAPTSLPEPLRQAMRELEARPVQVPPGVDAAVLAEARRQLRPTTEVPAAVGGRQGAGRWRVWMWRIAPVAAAATVVVAVWLGAFGGADRSAPGPQVNRFPAPQADVDGSGTVDVLDAYRLALDLQAGRIVSGHAGGDADGNGVVDAHDVEWITRTIVRLDPASEAGRLPDPGRPGQRGPWSLVAAGGAWP
jgi:hypothetical protein